MGIFYLVDQSLKGLGGHHFDYTRLLSEAATQAEWPIVVGCHRRFGSRDSLPGVEVRNCFRNTTYASCSTLVGIQEMVARRKRGLFSSLGKVFTGGTDSRLNRENSWFSKEQRNRIDAFREDCHRFFERPLTRKDVVFFTTLSDLETDGLYQFIRERPDAKLANWHLQFHFPIFRGRTPEYATQLSNMEYLVRTFRKLDTLSQTNIRYYVTSDNLKDQYELTGFHFDELPYPINPAMKGRGSRSAENSPLIRLAFAGAIRHEKGGNQIQQLIEQFDSATRSRISLCVQMKREKFTRRIRNWFKKEPEVEQVVKVPYPLDSQDYLDHIRNSDIGLLTTYDSETYFSRRAGILGEYLTAGVPVIVPAGSWLSDQIESAQRQYLRRLLDQEEGKRVKPKTISNRSNGSSVAVFENWNRNKETDSSRSKLAIVGFDVIKPSGHGNYFRVDLVNGGGVALGQRSQIVGWERQSKTQEKHRILAAIDLCDYSEDEIQFQISSANNGGELGKKPDSSSGLSVSTKASLGEWQLENIDMTILYSTRPIPRSEVGLVAANASQTADLTQEMIEQYEHYRRSAIEFSGSWFERHDPALTFQSLVTNSQFSELEKDQAA